MIDLPLLDSIVLGTDALAFLDRSSQKKSNNNRAKGPIACTDPSSTLTMRSCPRSRAS